MVAVDSSAIIVLAFVATAAVFGYLAFTIISEIHTPEEQGLLFSGSLVYVREGHIWKIVLPVATLDSKVDFRASRVSIVLNPSNGAELVADGGDGFAIYNSTVLTGTLVERIASFKMSITRNDSHGTMDSITVSVFAYMGPDKSFRLVIDDDSDGMLDDTYLLEFAESKVNNLVTGINLSRNIVARVEKGDVLTMSYLLTAYAASTTYDPQIVVIDGGKDCYISLVKMLKGLTKATVITMIAGGNSDYYLKSGETGYIVILLPGSAGLRFDSESIDLLVSIGGDQYKLKLLLPPKINDNGVFSGVVKVVS